MTSLTGTVILVTGADGFIGSHLTERLLDDGASVRALCVYNSNSSFGWLDEVAPRASLEPVLGDVRDGPFLRELVDGVDVVLHLAALIAIPYSYDAPSSFVDTNVTGTLNVLQAVRDAGTPLMVQTSTSEVYGTPDEVPITEDHALQAQSPYSATKIAADKLCESFARSFATPVATLRPFNTYGPRQSLRAVIPTVLQQLLAGTDRLELGNLDPHRDFTYVTDTVDGFVRMVAADPEPGTTVQLGTGQAISIRQLVDLCRRVTGNDAEVVVDEQRVRPADSEVDVLLSDPSRAKELLGWAPTTSLEEGLRATANWLRDHNDLDGAARYHR